MIHYHGTPITPDTVLADAMKGAHFCVSYGALEQLALVAEVGSSFFADNAAFKAWMAGEEVDWLLFYQWLRDCVLPLPSFDFFIIPDKIDGSEEDNDAMIEECPIPGGVPVWHLHESFGRLERMAADFRMIALGSSGQFATIGNPPWWRRMDEAMQVVCGADGRPHVQLHGLRMMDAKIVSRFPFKSADSTNVARNIGIDSKWTGSYRPPTKAARALVIRQRIESVNSPSAYAFGRVTFQSDLFELAA